MVSARPGFRPGQAAAQAEHVTPELKQYRNKRRDCSCQEEAHASSNAEKWKTLEDQRKHMCNCLGILLQWVNHSAWGMELLGREVIDPTPEVGHPKLWVTAPRLVRLLWVPSLYQMQPGSSISLVLTARCIALCQWRCSRPAHSSTPHHLLATVSLTGSNPDLSQALVECTHPASWLPPPKSSSTHLLTYVLSLIQSDTQVPNVGSTPHINTLLCCSYTELLALLEGIFSKRILSAVTRKRVNEHQAGRQYHNNNHQNWYPLNKFACWMFTMCPGLD